MSVLPYMLFFSFDLRWWPGIASPAPRTVWRSARASASGSATASATSSSPRRPFTLDLWTLQGSAMNGVAIWGSQLHRPCCWGSQLHRPCGDDKSDLGWQELLSKATWKMPIYIYTPRIFTYLDSLQIDVSICTTSRSNQAILMAWVRQRFAYIFGKVSFDLCLSFAWLVYVRLCALLQRRKYVCIYIGTDHWSVFPENVIAQSYICVWGVSCIRGGLGCSCVNGGGTIYIYIFI